MTAYDSFQICSRKKEKLFLFKSSCYFHVIGFLKLKSSLAMVFIICAHKVFFLKLSLLNRSAVIIYKLVLIKILFFAGMVNLLMMYPKTM